MASGLPSALTNCDTLPAWHSPALPAGRDQVTEIADAIGTGGD
jgi:hypothetical protein